MDNSKFSEKDEVVVDAITRELAKKQASARDHKIE
jgi:hypothetical protein